MIDFTKSLVSVGVGGVDEVLEWQDERAGRVESFRTWQDIGRLVGCGLGYAVQIFWPRQARWGEAIALPTTALLTKSVSHAVRGAMAPASRVSGKRYGPRRVAPPPTRVAAAEPGYTPEGEEIIFSVT